MIPLRHKLTRGSFTLGVDVEIPDTGITGVFGESGSGKSTLLRCIAGLEHIANVSFVGRETVHLLQPGNTPQQCRFT